MMASGRSLAGFGGSRPSKGEATHEKAQVKGTAVLGTIRFIKETFGEEGLSRVLSHLDEEDRARWRRWFWPRPGTRCLFSWR